MPFMSVPVGMVQMTARWHHFAGNLMLTSLSYFSWSMAVPFFLPVARWAAGR